MSGTLVLEGGDPFVANDELDRRVLAEVDRVVMLPTADAFEQPQDLVDAALAWGDRIGVEVEPLMVLTRAQAGEEAARVVYDSPAVFLAGDSGSHLRSVMKDTPLFDAVGDVLTRGGVVVAAAASAAALCDPMTDPRGGAFGLGLGLVSGVAVIPAVETWSTDRLERAHQLAHWPVIELPTGSAAVRTEAGWELVGGAVVRGELPTP